MDAFRQEARADRSIEGEPERRATSDARCPVAEGAAERQMPTRIQQLGLLILLTALIVYVFANVGW